MMSNAFPLLHGNKLCNLLPGLCQQLATAGMKRAEAKLCSLSYPGHHGHEMSSLCHGKAKLPTPSDNHHAVILPAAAS